MTSDEFLARYPEFESDSDEPLESILEETAERIDPDVFGDRYDEAHGALCAHELWSSAFGVSLRQEGDAPDFQIPQGFRVRDHIGRTRWEYQDLASAFDGAEAARPFTARVRFEAAVAPDVRSHVPSARILAQDERWETLEFDVRRRRPFARFLLRYVPRLVIEAPLDLEADVRALARQVVARYGPTSPAASSPRETQAQPVSP